jgi:hypothetical protein
MGIFDETRLIFFETSHGTEGARSDEANTLVV